MRAMKGLIQTMASKTSPSSEIARLISNKTGIPIPMAEDIYFTVVNAMIDIIDRDQRLWLFGFGTFEIDYSYPKTVKNKRAKTARLTPPKVTIPENISISKLFKKILQ
ncbi:MAG: hypothetical protein EBR90_02540 [Actinobacteria bacterium]|nr:hypothetical protein [Actinomycetota bacterium]